jgi:hypothetical protein
VKSTKNLTRIAHADYAWRRSTMARRSQSIHNGSKLFQATVADALAGLEATGARVADKASAHLYEQAVPFAGCRRRVSNVIADTILVRDP